MKKSLLLVIILGLCLVAAACGGGEQPAETTPPDTPDQQEPAPVEVDPIPLKYATYHDQSNALIAGFWMFVENAENSIGDQLDMTYVGGPETIPANDMFDAVRNGVIDFAIVPTTYYSNQVPEMIALDGSLLSPEEERAAGAVELIDEAHRQHGVVYLGKATAGFGYNLMLNKEVDWENIDLSGLVVRISLVNKDFFQSMGASTQTIAPPELYTALERNVVDGFGWPAIGAISYGFHEVTKYRVANSFYQLADVVLFNENTWNSLPDEVKDGFVEAMAKAEIDTQSLFQGLIEEEEAAYVAAGAEIITLSSEAEAAFIAKAQESKWQEAMNAAPEFTEKYRAIVDPQ